MAPTTKEYDKWSHDDLVSRVMELESQLRSHTVAAATVDSTDPSSTTATAPAKKPKTKKTFDASRYSTHHIALQFAYIGGRYNGFEHHVNNTTPLTTIEEELWRALMKARLIFPTPREARNGHVDEPAKGQQHWEGPVNWTGCDYSKCGRTDRGVSAFGQVIALRVRSNRPLAKQAPLAPEPSQPGEELDNDVTAAESVQEGQPSFDPIRDEINYPALLNNILPPDIRVLAWAPAPTSNFSARFSCKERRYKYFFTQPAFLPVPSGDADSAVLDIERMRKATEHLISAHDFRNFCKIDASKQITNFVRRITHASVDEVSNVDVPSFFTSPAFAENDLTAAEMKVYAFSLHGTAFLWHQVRCIMAVLFLVGQRLEEPEVVRDMLDMSLNGHGRPKYEMANETPLVLWDCIFPLRPGDDDGKPYETGERIEDAIDWIYASKPDMQAGKTKVGGFDSHWGRNGLMDSLWRQWRGRKMDEILAGALMGKAAALCMPPAPLPGLGDKSKLVFDGSNGARAGGNYVPLMHRERMEPVEVINERFAARKGLPSARTNGAVDEVEDNE